MSLTDYIKKNLIAGFHSGQIGQGELTLVDLSARYQVSVTPVRAAVKQLIHEGYLEQQSNRRLIVRMDRAERVGDDFSGAEAPKDWYRTIANDLVHLSLRGEPILLREESTAKKYGISRSSLRQIFNRLAGDGVLQHLPRCGWRLRPLSPSDLDAYTDIRVVLECRALELAWPRLVDEDLQAMLAGNRLPAFPGDPPLGDNNLHAYLIEKAGNHYISEFFARHAKYYDTLFHWVGLDQNLIILVVQDHQHILNALLRRDRQVAEDLLVQHIRRNQPFLKKRMQDEFSGEAPGGSGGHDASCE